MQFREIEGRIPFEAVPSRIRRGQVGIHRRRDLPVVRADLREDLLVGALVVEKVDATDGAERRRTAEEGLRLREVETVL